MPSHLVVLATVLGFLLSPETLVILGTGLGRAGTAFPAALVLCLPVYVFTACKLDFSQAKPLASGPGGFALAGVAACARFGYAVCASAGMLASAGFVVNEVFFYWFPNFLFAHLLLLSLFVLNWRAPVQAPKLMPILAGIAVSAVLLLIGAALWQQEGKEIANRLDLPPGLALCSLATTLFVFTGFDLAAFVRKKNADPPGPRMAIGLGIGCLVLVAWSMATVVWVPMERLSQSTVPHLLAARHILGAPGAAIMGLAAVAAAAAMVNAFFLAIPQMVDQLAGQGSVPPAWASRPALPRFLLAGAVAAMLLSGMAGSPNLEILIRGALLLWILYHGLAHLTRLRRPAEAGPHSIPAKRATSLCHGGAATFLIIGFGAIVSADPDRDQLLAVMAIGVAAAGSAGFVLTRAGRRPGAARDPGALAD